MKKHPSNIGFHGTHIPKSKPRKNGSITSGEMITRHLNDKQALELAKRQEIDHVRIRARLNKIGFYQTIQHRTACYYNRSKPILCAYIAPNNGENCYVFCFGQHRYSFTTIRELNIKWAMINNMI
jgi:hypothetical protein